MILGLIGEVCILVITTFLAYVAYGMKLGVLQKPGAGLWPFMLCVIIAILALVAGLANLQEKKYVDFTLKRISKPLMAMASIALYAFAMERLGYILPTLMLAIFWLRVIGGESWRSTLMFAVGITGLFFFIFSHLLGVPFPRDILFILFK